jgi:hypothetical protein
MGVILILTIVAITIIFICERMGWYIKAENTIATEVKAVENKLSEVKTNVVSDVNKAENTIKTDVADVKTDAVNVDNSVVADVNKVENAIKSI